MSLPAAWVDKIFEKLTIRYGRDFLSQWEGIPVEDVKDDWSNCLSGLFTHPSALAYGLDNLPDGKAPNAQQFRAICRRAPEPVVPRLEAPQARPDLVARELAKLAKPAAKVDGREWARRVLDRIAAGDRVAPAVERFAKEALRA